MGALKQLLLNCLMVPGFPASLKHVQRHCATIFMLHRFHDSERGIEGCDVGHLRTALAYLKKNGYECVSLLELFRRLAGEGQEPRGAVAFTIDDGYVDQATIAAPIFAEFGIPVTTFVSSGFLDNKLWFWWDQIGFIFENTACKSLQVKLGERTLSYEWADNAARLQAQSDLTEQCKRVPNVEKLAAILQLAKSANVIIPELPPRHCAPMTWEQLRSCEKLGMTFGPHTVTHPVLSRTTPEQARHEIAESWARLRAEASNPVPIFCYPNGGWEDFGDREIEILRELGFIGGVVGEPGYASALNFSKNIGNPFKVQRFGLPDVMPNLVQYVSGVERFKQILRGSGV